MIEGTATAPTGQWLSRGSEDWGQTVEEAPWTDEELVEAAFDSDDSDASNFLPGRVWGIDAGALPWFRFRVNPGGRVLPAHALPVIHAVHAMPALRHL